MSNPEYPLSLVVRAVDKASGPIRALTEKAERTLAPFNAIGDRVRGLGAQLGGLGKALNLPGIWEAAGKFGGALRGVGSAALDVIGKLTAIGLAGGAAFLGIVKGAMDAGDKLGEVAGRVGLGVDAFASLQYAAAQSDVEAEAFSSGLDKLNKQLGDMTVGKGGEFLNFLNEISPTFAKQMKAAKGTEAALALLTDAFAKIDDPAKRATLSAHAFGKTNLQMGEWLHSGSSAIQEQQREFMRLFGSQENAARAAGELDNATRRSETAFLGLRMAAAGALFPALTKVANVLTEFMVKHRDSLSAWATKAGAAIEAWVDGGGIERLVDTLSNVATTIGRVVEWLGPLGTGLAGLGVISLPLVSALGSLAASGLSLAVSVWPLLAAAGSALWPVLVSVGTAIGGVASTVGVLALEFLPFIAAIAGIVLAAKAIRDNWGDLAFIFRDWGNSLKWAVIDAWATVRPILEKLSGFFGGGLNPFGSALAVGDMLVPNPGAGALPPPPAPASAVGAASSSRVSVDFSNLPRGAQISSSSSPNASLDLSAGYSMVTP